MLKNQSSILMTYDKNLPTYVQTLLYHLISTFGAKLYYIYISFLFQTCHVLTDPVK